MYLPPSYKCLLEQTTTLLETYNEVAKRYVSPSYAELRRRCGAMKSDYCRLVDQKPSYQLSYPDPERLKQIEYISHLVLLLPQEDDSASQNVLLGALFYRLITIRDGYKGWTFFGWKEENSALFRIIEEILGLGKNVTMPDDLTLATCCLAYHDYLLVLREKGDEQKKAIPQDSDVFGRLRTIFHPAKARAEVMIRAIETLELVSRFVGVFDTFRRDIEGSIGDFLSKLVKKFEERDVLTKKEIKSILSSSLLKERVAMMLANFIDTVPEHFTLDAKKIYLFREKLIGINVVNSQYALLGFYIVIFEREKDASPDLCKVIIGATKGEGELSAIDDHARVLALSALLNYFSLRCRPDGWGLGQHFNTFFEEAKALQQKSLEALSLREMIQSTVNFEMDMLSEEQFLSL